jgi:hypothetical protein
LTVLYSALKHASVIVITQLARTAARTASALSMAGSYDLIASSSGWRKKVARMVFVVLKHVVGGTTSTA